MTAPREPWHTCPEVDDLANGLSSDAHDPLTCPCCTAAATERAELVALTEEIREAGRALATLAEHRMEGCLRNHGVKGRCPGCERDEAIERWAKANWRWSMRESAGGNDT